MLNSGSHIEMRIEDNIASGMSPDKARRVRFYTEAALRAFRRSCRKPDFIGTLGRGRRRKERARPLLPRQIPPIPLGIHSQKKDNFAFTRGECACSSPDVTCLSVRRARRLLRVRPGLRP
jgi:hypothetical protein